MEQRRMSLFRLARRQGSLVLFRYPAWLDSLTLLGGAIIFGALAYGAHRGWLKGEGWGCLAAAIPLGILALFGLKFSIGQMWTHQQLVVDTEAGHMVFTSRTPLDHSTELVRFAEINAVRLRGTVTEQTNESERSGTLKVELLLETRTIPMGEGDECLARELASSLSELVNVSLRDEVVVRPYEPDLG
jgi:hypothetical protein